MEGETTLIDVLDNAVKIGFGAILGGLLAILAERMKHGRDQREKAAEHQRLKQEKQADYRRAMTRDISLKINNFHSLVNTLCYDIYRTAFALENKNRNVDDIEIEKLNNLRRQLYPVEYQNLISAWSELRLLGDKVTADILTEYTDMTFEIAPTDVEYSTRNLKVSTIEAQTEKLGEIRSRLLDKLSADFGGIS